MKTPTQFQKYTDITDEDIKNMEKEHGKLKFVCVPLVDEDDEDYEPAKIDPKDKKFDPSLVARFILKRNPKRSVIKSIRFYATQTPPNFEKIEKLSKNEVLLGGDLKYLDEDEGRYDIYVAVDKAIGDVMNGKEVKLGKR